MADLLRLAARAAAIPTWSGWPTSTCRSPSAAATATRAAPGTPSPSRSRTQRGEPLLNYEGNWRDIFQNWEALALSFPGYIESMISKFVDASTADGYNPYRITRDGFEWEVLDPHDAWSLHRLLGRPPGHLSAESAGGLGPVPPGRVGRPADRSVFTYANVPYRIKPYAAMLEDPRNTIDFDDDLGRDVAPAMSPQHWAPTARSLHGPDGAPCPGQPGARSCWCWRCAKLSNFIPEAGIWMNTQRPEWNDANNALVGYGVSMVTLYYLRRYLAFCRDLFRSAGWPTLEVLRGSGRGCSQRRGRSA